MPSPNDPIESNEPRQTPPPPQEPPPLDPAAMLAVGFESQPAGSGPGGTDDVPAAEELASEFPQLELLSVLGRGGMGVVYKARQKALDRLVALKVIGTRVANHPQFAERFQREARAMARLSHPNIVAVHEFGQTATGRHYLVMEFMEGTNLRQVLRAGRMKPSEALAIVPRICDALQYAHDEGVVHRDIKPENILVDVKGRVKIADFGLAKLLGPASPTGGLTDSNVAMGTPQYMAPEQFERPLEVDHRADVYALGVVLYEMLTGELPLGRFASPSEKSDVDVRIDEVVLRALERDPKQRYQHASEVRTGIEEAATAPPPLQTQYSRAALASFPGQLAGLVLSLVVVKLMVLVSFSFSLGASVGLARIALIVLGSASTALGMFSAYQGLREIRDGGGRIRGVLPGIIGLLAAPGVAVSLLFMGIFRFAYAVIAAWGDVGVLSRAIAYPAYHLANVSLGVWVCAGIVMGLLLTGFLAVRVRRYATPWLPRPERIRRGGIFPTLVAAIATLALLGIGLRSASHSDVTEPLFTIGAIQPWLALGHDGVWHLEVLSASAVALFLALILDLFRAQRLHITDPENAPRRIRIVRLIGSAFTGFMALAAFVNYSSWRPTPTPTGSTRPTRKATGLPQALAEGSTEILRSGKPARDAEFHLTAPDGRTQVLASRVSDAAWKPGLEGHFSTPEGQTDVYMIYYGSLDTELGATDFWDVTRTYKPSSAGPLETLSVTIRFDGNDVVVFDDERGHLVLHGGGTKSASAEKLQPLPANNARVRIFLKGAEPLINPAWYDVGQPGEVFAANWTTPTAAYAIRLHFDGQRVNANTGQGMDQYTVEEKRTLAVNGNILIQRHTFQYASVASVSSKHFDPGAEEVWKLYLTSRDDMNWNW